MRGPTRSRPVEAALDTLLDSPPRRVLDVGTGTGAVARLVADALSGGARSSASTCRERMIDEARRLTDSPRVRFQVADAQKLPFADGAFDLVTLGNMIPFFDELARVTAPGGHVLVAYSAGAETPIYVPPERLRARARARADSRNLRSFRPGAGRSLLATKS